MKILILNWRDIKNPSSGGAEILTHEIAKRFVEWGHEVVQFSSYFANASHQETIDEVKIIRQGYPDTRSLFASVHFRALLFYMRRRKYFDVVIDEIHGIPFFTPWYVKEKKIALICEVGNDSWKRIYGFFFGMVGRLTEKFYLSYIYKDMLFMTISESTKRDLVKEGVNIKNIAVLPMGINVPKQIANTKKEKKVTLIFVGRLTVAKGIEEALTTLEKIRKHNKDIKLWVVGRGKKDYINYLKKMCQELGILQYVTFFGFVSETEKFSLLSRAHILIHPSFREGFGLTIPEAGYVRTPVVAYDSPGLRDIVRNNYNGILAKENSPEALAEEIVHILDNSDLYKKLCQGAFDEARQYNWDNTAKVMLANLQKL